MRLLLLASAIACATLAAHAAAAPQPEAAPAAEAAAADDAPAFLQSEIEVLIEVRGVASLADYAQVVRQLGVIDGVRRVGLIEALADRAVFRVASRGGSEALAAALAGGGTLVRTDSGAGRMQLELRR